LGKGGRGNRGVRLAREVPRFPSHIAYSQAQDYDEAAVTVSGHERTNEGGTSSLACRGENQTRTIKPLPPQGHMSHSLGPQRVGRLEPRRRTQENVAEASRFGGIAKDASSLAYGGVRVQIARPVALLTR
jgi:hypothetical protein